MYSAFFILIVNNIIDTRASRQTLLGCTQCRQHPVHNHIMIESWVAGPTYNVHESSVTSGGQIREEQFSNTSNRLPEFENCSFYNKNKYILLQRSTNSDPLAVMSIKEILK